MKLAIITPIVLQNEQMLNIYLSNLASYHFVVNTSIYLICNRLTFDKDYLEDKIKSAIGSRVNVFIFNDKERSVAGAWNFGLYRAMEDGFELFHILAADIALHRNTHKILLDKIRDYELCSSVDFKSSYGRIHDDVGAADFSSVLFKKLTFAKYGMFDREYKPAYFEDNDFMARVNAYNGKYAAINSAIHYHYGSATINVDAEMAHHVKYWFETNRKRFIKKWGGDVNTGKEKLFKYPMNDPTKPIDWYPEKDRQGYAVDGGIHE